MTYQAFCNLHPEFVADERDDYAAAVEDFQAHLDDEHALGVRTIGE